MGRLLGLVEVLSAVVKGEVKERLHRLVVTLVCCAVGGIVGLIGLVFLLRALALLLIPTFGPIGAPAVVGAGLIVIAALTLAIGLHKPKGRRRRRIALPSVQIPVELHETVVAEVPPSAHRAAAAKSAFRKKAVFNVALGALIAGLVLGRKV